MSDLQCADCGYKTKCIYLFRCYYCESYFCKDCAPSHFELEDDAPNKPTRAEWEQLELIKKALRESVKLQAHYAELLNMHDGGCRRIFPTVDMWIARMKETT